MKPDLKSMNRKELEKLKANVEKALVKLSEKDKKTALAAAEKAAAAHGFSLAELSGETAPLKTRKAKTAPTSTHRFKVSGFAQFMHDLHDVGP